MGGCGRVGFDSSSARDGDAGSTFTGHAISAQSAYLKASNTDAQDRFGFSVALSADGTTLAVGADLESSAATGVDGNQADTSALNAGAVYILTSVGTPWVQQPYLKATIATAAR